jgi:hypothetical protein
MWYEKSIPREVVKFKKDEFREFIDIGPMGHA